MKKFLCVFLVLIMVLTMGACSEEDTQEANIHYFGSEAGREKLKSNPNPLDPAAVYNSIPKDERILYGIFEIENSDDNLASFAQSAVFEEITYSETYGIYTAEENVTTAKLSTLPVKIEFGHPGSNYGRKLRGEHEWAVLYLVNERGYKVDVLCTYTVSGNTVSFTPLAGYEEVQNESYLAQKILYEVGEDSIDYTFDLQGTILNLTRDGKSVTLKSWYFSGNVSSCSFGGHLATGSPVFAGLDHFTCSLSSDYTSVYLTMQDEEIYSHNYDNACVALNENGQISFYWESKDAQGNVVEHIEHLVYYPGCGYSSILADGSNIYYYTETSLTRDAVAIGEGMTQEEQEQLSTMTDTQIEQISQKRADLLADLAAAYKDADLNVTINSQTGEISLDSTVLFGVNESSISADGKAFLQKFTQIYVSVVYSDKYADFVSRIMVEGHTDTSGSYELNLALSQARADSVKEYCLSEECGLDSAYQALFAQSLEAIGYSYDKPIYDADGNVDMDASRRVSFRFIVRLS